MNARQLVDAIATKTRLDPAAAERAAGTILSVIQQEVYPTVAASLSEKLPGASDLAAANAVSAASGGFLNSIATSVLGSKDGVLAAGLTQLEASGLTLAQIESAVTSILACMKNGADGDLAKQVASALPGLVKPP